MSERAREGSEEEEEEDFIIIIFICVVLFNDACTVRTVAMLYVFRM